MKERIISNFKAGLFEKIPVEYINDITDILAITLENYDVIEKERSLILFDDSDVEILKKFVLAKAVEGLSHNSLTFYCTALNLFFKAANKKIVDITAEDVRVYLAKKKIAKCSDKTLNNYRRVLNSFFGWCVEEGILDQTPMLRIKNIREAKKIERPLTDEQLEKVRYCAQTKREKAIIEFLFSTGCRLAEMVDLNISDIDFEKGETIVRGKGNKFRTVYLSQRAIFALRDYIDERSDNNPALFVNDTQLLKGGLANYIGEKTQRLNRGGIGSLCKKWSKKVGFRVHPHLFRKTVATSALRKGMAIDQVQKMLGHSDIKTTTIYAQTLEDDVKTAHSKYVG